jgi:hypothetical protein
VVLRGVLQAFKLCAAISAERDARFTLNMVKPRAQVAVASRRTASDPTGFSSLARLHNDLSALRDADITIDLAKLGWLDGHLAGPLMVVMRHAERRGNSISLINTQEPVAALLKKNRFFARHSIDEHNTTMPLTEFTLEQSIGFSLYAKKHLDRREMPKMSKALRGKFFEGIDELFANSALHSKSVVSVAACGQFFPAKERLDFVLTDGGRGIPGSVRGSFPDRNLTDDDAISWAMEPFNTTYRAAWDPRSFESSLR